MNKKNCQRKSILSSNKGFSLIELLVVIAIMAVATGLVTITYSLVHNANVAKAANTLDTAFNKARIQSMAKGADAGQLNVWVDGGVMYYTIGKDNNPDTNPNPDGKTAVNSAVISIYVPTVGMDVTDIATCVYRFNSAGMVTSPAGPIPDEWQFYHGNRRVKVVFYFETGKHMTELL